MKIKILPLAFTLLLIISFYKYTFSQCTPTVFPGTAMLSPDTGSTLTNGAATQPYSTVIQILIPSTYTPSGIPIPVPVDSLHISSVVGLPTGFSYLTNKISNSWVKNERGCIVIQGNPTSNNVGNYVINFNIIGYVSGSPNPLSLNNQGNYKLKIWDATHVSIEKIDESKDQILNIFPNPVSSSASIEYYSVNAKTVKFEIVNILGSVVYSSSKALISGKNTIKFDKGNLPSGLYWVKITSETDKLIKKLIVQ
jgi:hypothetical protein